MKKIIVLIAFLIPAMAFAGGSGSLTKADTQEILAEIYEIESQIENLTKEINDKIDGYDYERDLEGRSFWKSSQTQEIENMNDQILELEKELGDLRKKKQ